MDRLSQLRNGGSHQRGVALVVAAIAAALAIASAAPALATPTRATAWGDDQYGQLGDGTTTDSSLPVAVSELSGITAVSAGGEHGLALLSNGTVMSWGENEEGELGDGTSGGISDLPVAVSGLSGVTAISAGTRYSLALLSNGTVMAWGDNQGGELGDGSTGGISDVPVAVKNLSGVTAISAGKGSHYIGQVHSLALLSNGTVMAWGVNAHGELGDGKTASSNVPVAVKNLHGATSVSAGNGYSLAGLEGGTAMAWGANGVGQLGDGNLTDTSLPVAVSGLSDATALSASSAHSLALLSSGTVVAWGENFSGQLGNGSDCSYFDGTCASDVPITVSGLSGVTAIAAGGTGGGNPGGYSEEENEHSLALLSNGTVVAWGSNLFGQLGHWGSEPGYHTDTPTPVSGLSQVTGISGGGVYSLAFGRPVPGVINLSPSQGSPAGGTAVTITGINFTGTTSVDFGSTAATSFTVNSSTSITAISPAEPAGVVDVTVSTPEGTSPTTSADRFSYGVPTVMSLKPKAGPAEGGTAVKITGTNLLGATAVRFGSTQASSFSTQTVRGATSITAVSPAEHAGLVDVTVTGPGGTSAVSSRDRYRFLPTVTGLSPGSGTKAGGTSVVVTGTGFEVGSSQTYRFATKFKFGTTKSTSVDCTSTTECVVLSPAHAVGTVDVRAIVEGETSAKNAPADQFTYN